ncbi:MAG: ribbon-helix-helix domain-containing protein [Chloroflexota bacterium]|nr:ribbon-helix-helix domain-containing protein [Chloroflexota bacterium]
MRTHIVLPEELVDNVDRVVGKRRRSRFVEEAIREKLRRDELLAALEETAGILSDMDYPEWETSQKTAEWVRESRRGDEERMARLNSGG